MNKQEKREQDIYQNGFNASFIEIEEIFRVEAKRLDHELSCGYPSDVHIRLKCKMEELEMLRAEILKE